MIAYLGHVPMQSLAHGEEHKWEGKIMSKSAKTTKGMSQSSMKKSWRRQRIAHGGEKTGLEDFIFILSERCPAIVTHL